MPRKPSKQLIATAYHEAGHAVAAHFLELPLRRATIVPNEEEGTAGHVLYRPLPQRLREALAYGRPTPAQRVRAENQVISAFAGPIAERRYYGRRNLVGASSDYQQIADFLFALSASDDEVTAYANWLEQRAISLIETRWRAVEAVATALLERQTLSGSEVQGVIYAHFKAALPDRAVSA